MPSPHPTPESSNRYDGYKKVSVEQVIDSFVRKGQQENMECLTSYISTLCGNDDRGLFHSDNSMMQLALQL